ncbi:hypothetical protein GCM10010435_58950 [Winogradskya consettensis]|uniref:Protein kinase domain-containing protein n=1 Tax=Winogradskya consettensis TaxID=113560 RepID=A0A919VSW3_9ACTN|nr:hypothetical protein Aco04nite_39330 [Actinoplanes consettensis]
MNDVIESGGMGTVYHVSHLGWDIDLAIKVAKEVTPQRVDLFAREAETWVRLGLHPHTVSCAYVRRYEDAPLVFAEWVAGGTLEQAITKRRLYRGDDRDVLRRLLGVVVQFAWGLRHAHDSGLIHQDLKPSNVLLTEEPDSTVKITDFGLARARAVAAGAAPARPGSTLAVTGAGLFTPAYRSPEQGQGAATLTKATDIWSWAITVFEIFAGTTPLQAGENAHTFFAAWLVDDQRDTSIPAMPARLAALLRRCFETDPRRRTVRMDEAISELLAIYRAEIGSPYDREEPSAAALRADQNNNRALSLLDLGRPDDARHAWEEALAAEPYHRHSVYNLGLHRWRRGEMTSTRLDADLRAAASARDEDPEVDHLRAMVLLEGGHPAAAAQLLTGIAPTATAVTPDGRVIIALGNGSAQVRLVASGELLSSWAGADGFVAVSADGSTAACGTHGAVVAVHDATTGAQRARITLPAEPSALALDPTGAVLVAACVDSSVTTWLVSTGVRRHTLQPGIRFPRDTVGRLRFTPDGSAITWLDLLLLRLRTWDAQSGFLLDSVPYGRGTDLDPSARHSFTGTRHDPGLPSAVALSYELTDDELTDDEPPGMGLSRPLPPAAGDDPDVEAVSIDETYAVLNHDEIWDLTSGRMLRRRGSIEDSDPITDTGAGGVTTAPGGKTRAFLEFNGAGPRMSWSYARPLGAETISAAFTAVRRALDTTDPATGAAAAAALRKARDLPGHRRDPALLDLWARVGRQGRPSTLLDAWPIQEIPVPGDRRSAAITPDGRHIVLQADSEIQIRGARSGDPHLTLADQVTAMALAATGRLLTADPGHGLRLWDLAGPDNPRTLARPSGTISSIRVSGDGSLAVTRDPAGSFRLWDLAAARRIPNPPGAPGQADSVRLGPTGELLFVTDLRRQLSLWQVHDGRQRRGPHGPLISDPLGVSGDGRTALLREWGDRVVWTFDVERGEPVHRLAGHAGPVRHGLFTDDGRTAVTAGEDGTIRVWDVTSGAGRHTLPGHRGRISGMNLAGVGSLIAVRGGRFLISAGHDHVVRVWDLDTGTAAGVLGPGDEATGSDDGRFVLVRDAAVARLWELDWDIDFPERPLR